MKTITTFVAGLALGVAASLAGAPVYAQTEPGARFARAAPVAVLRVGPDRGRSYVPAEVVPGPLRAAIFVVDYVGFTPAARRAFQRALDNWARLISSSVPISVHAQYVDFGDQLRLGFAHAGSLEINFPGAPRRNTFYVEAGANKNSGQQLYPENPDIFAYFNSSFPNWHFGSGPAPAGEYDFTTVVMHELAHGLGFIGFGKVNKIPAPERGTVRNNHAGDTRRPSIYDRFTENSNNTLLNSMPDLSRQLANQLQSNRLFYDSPRVRDANDNKPAKIYAPSTFVEGSSYVHLDESTFPNGDKNSLMTPHLGPGETIRSPGPITRAIFKDGGW